MSGQRFPEDLFAQPAFQVFWDKDNPIRNGTAVQLLMEQEQDASGASSTGSSSAASSGDENPLLLEEQEGTEGTHYLLRTAPHLVHLCHIPTPRVPTDTEASAPYSSTWYLERLLNSSSSNTPSLLSTASRLSSFEESKAMSLLDSERKRIIAHGLHLLEPLKSYCVYLHMGPWFTYSFCHGKHVRQFKALPPQAAAMLAAAQQQQKAAAATEQGANAAGPAAADAPAAGGEAPSYQSLFNQRRLPNGDVVYEVAFPASFKPDAAALKNMRAPPEPMEDKTFDAFVLGRWKEGVEIVAGTDLHFREMDMGHSSDTRTDQASSEGEGIKEDGSVASDTTEEGSLGEGKDVGSGTELMEVVRFGQEEEKRYLVQTWTDGTRCDINNEPRMIEVQVRRLKSHLLVSDSKLTLPSLS